MPGWVLGVSQYAHLPLNSSIAALRIGGACQARLKSKLSCERCFWTRPKYPSAARRASVTSLEYMNSGARRLDRSTWITKRALNRSCAGFGHACVSLASQASVRGRPLARLRAPAKEARHLEVIVIRARRFLRHVTRDIGRRSDGVSRRSRLDRARRPFRWPGSRRGEGRRDSVARRLRLRHGRLGPLVPIQPGRDQRDEDVLAERWAEARPEDDVGVGVSVLADLLGRLPNLAQPEV